MSPENTKKLFDKFGHIIDHLNGEDFRCDDGWFPILWNTYSALEGNMKILGVDIKVAQTKEKFGRLVIYLHKHGIKSLDAIVDAAYDISKTTCERCGSGKGELKDDKFYVQTLCNKCYKEKQDEFGRS